MNPDVAPPGPGRWLPVRDRVTGRLLCEYDPQAGLIRVRRNRRYYTAPLPPAPVLNAISREGNPTPGDICSEGALALQKLIEAAHQLLHLPDPACPEDPDHDPPAP